MNMIIKHDNTRSAGVTLIELLIAMALISMLLVALTSIFTSSLELQLRAQATSSRQEDADYILSRLYYDVNQASAITNPSSINEQTNSIGLTVNGESWTYTLSDGDLILTNPAGTFQLNSHLTQLTQFDVRRVGNSTGTASIDVTITIGNRISGSQGDQTATYSTTYSVW
jgi:prepilin-type N-terminal cleavage/methylation domain-containing protein